MRKHTVSITLLAGFLTMFNANALLKSNNTAQVSFTGSLLSMTCNIGVGNSASNTTIQLPTVSSSSLSSAGDTAGRTNVNLSVSGCPDLESVKAYFESGSDVDPSTGRLKNTITKDAGGSTGIELQLLDGNGGASSVIKIGSSDQDDQSISVPIIDGQAQLSYMVEYYTSSGDVTPGKFNSSVEYVITYQ